MNKIIVQNFGYKEQAFHIDTLTLEYLVEITATAMYQPCKLSITDLALVQFFLNKFPDVNILVVSVLHVWLIFDTEKRGAFPLIYYLVSPNTIAKMNRIQLPHAVYHEHMGRAYVCIRIYRASVDCTRPLALKLAISIVRTKRNTLSLSHDITRKIPQK